MTQKPSLIYFLKPVGLDGPIKIGCSNWPADRLLSLGAWSPIPLELIGSLPGSRKDETFLHECFADLHSHREWFHAQPRLTEAIRVAVRDGSLENVQGLKRRGSIRPKRKPLTDAQRRRFSYLHRLRWANQRLSELDVPYWQRPSGLSSVVYGWGESDPPAAELARINAYLADPMAHIIVPAWVSI